MRATSLELKNFRSFESMGPIDLGQINVLIGPNNSGKSSILKALHLLQEGGGEIYPDVRVTSASAQVTIGLADMHGEFDSLDEGTLKIIIRSSNRSSGEIDLAIHNPDGPIHGKVQRKNIDPYHFVVPFLSKRKTNYYQEDVKEESALRVNTDMSNLAAKLSRLANPGFPVYEQYSKACKEILGFVVTAIPSRNGMRPGVYLPDRKTIDISQMGEGVPNVVGMLADLALSEEKLFLIEEPENDLHPQALKALLDLMVLSSESNQFVISTHSNIVVRHLASIEKSKLYSVSSELGKLPPEATVREVEPTVEARLEVLRELGYSFSDFDLWDGWLMLEESSAERIIRDYLIPWFAPKLARVRTLAVGGVNQVEPTFDDFHRLVRFTHLEEAYRDAVWVRVDGDQVGIDVVSRLKSRYSSWQPDRFGNFGETQFEHYYPSEFEGKIRDALNCVDRQARREAKRILLDNVRAWLDEDEQRAREALEKSAAEVITHLQQIESQLAKYSR
ncbi:MAG: AAA family ATPase [Gallionella sp.]|nr:AAA family ATPase [Gallionella sp.]